MKILPPPPQKSSSAIPNNPCQVETILTTLEELLIPHHVQSSWQIQSNAKLYGGSFTRIFKARTIISFVLFIYLFFFCVIRTCKYTKRTTLEVVVIFPSCFCFLRLPDPIHPIPSTGIRAAFSFKWEARQRSQPTSKHLLNLLSPPPTIKSFTQRSSDPVDAKESPKIPKNLGVFPSQNLRDPLRIEFLIGINRTEIQLIGTIPT